MAQAELIAAAPVDELIAALKGAGFPHMMVSGETHFQRIRNAMTEVEKARVPQGAKMNEVEHSPV